MRNPTHTHTERLHALDATRAFALLLGVVFQAAWSFTAAPMVVALEDPNGGIIFDWFFFTSHTFRMQLFFLIAGFSAHLVCHRRGFSAFVRNRLARIGRRWSSDGWACFRWSSSPSRQAAKPPAAA